MKSREMKIAAAVLFLLALGGAATLLPGGAAQAPEGHGEAAAHQDGEHHGESAAKAHGDEIGDYRQGENDRGPAMDLANRRAHDRASTIFQPLPEGSRKLASTLPKRAMGSWVNSTPLPLIAS